MYVVPAHPCLSTWVSFCKSAPTQKNLLLKDFLGISDAERFSLLKWRQHQASQQSPCLV